MEVLEGTQPIPKSSWKKVSGAEITLDLEKYISKAPSPILKIDCQFRQSKFTRMPQGTLEVILAKGRDLRYKNESFRPILEICVGNQRVVQDELINPMVAQWTHGLMNFATHSWVDNFEMRIYVDQEIRVGTGGALGSLSGGSKVSNLSLLGIFTRPLNSIYYDDDVADHLDIELRNISEDLGGQIQLHFEFYPHSAGQEKEKSIQTSQVKEKGPVKHEDKKSATTLGPKFEKRAGICYL